MSLKLFRYIFYMIPVLGSSIKDLFLKRLPREEIKINYLFGKANSYEQANLLESSIQVYQGLLKKEPNSISVFMNLGGLYFRGGMIEKAIPYYQNVIHSNPKHYQGHYWLAVCYWKLKRYYAAINTLEEVIEFLPTFRDALNLIGECYERIGEAAKAEHYYLKAINANPDGGIIHSGILGHAVHEKKREERVKH